MGDKMIKYGLILLKHEKSNQTPFLRATYLYPNTGTLIYSYGRMLRFPEMEKEYKAEMKTALGDILMQCRMMEIENEITPLEIANIDSTNTKPIYEVSRIALDAAWILRYVTTSQEEVNYTGRIEDIIVACYTLCDLMNWNPEEIEHLGFIHTIERFEQFEREGWK